MKNELNVLRSQIDEVDQCLLNLLAKRLLLVTQVGEIKSRYGLLIYDSKREESILSSRRKEALLLGISPDLVEDILRRIMRDSYVNENEKGFKNLCPLLVLRPIIVISKFDEIGELFTRMFILSGYQVKYFKHEDWYTEKEILRSAIVILINVSSCLILDVITKLSGLLSSDCILLHVLTAYQKTALQLILDHYNGPVLSLQLMFNGNIRNLVKKSIIYNNGRMPEKYQWLLSQIRIWGAHLFSSNLLDYDKNIFLIKELFYFFIFIYGFYLNEEHLDINKIIILSSSEFRFMLIFINRFFSQDSRLFIDFLVNLKENFCLIEHYYTRLGKVVSLLQNNDVQGLVEDFENTKLWLNNLTGILFKDSQILLRCIDDI